MKNKLTLLLFFFLSVVTYGQNESQFTQYMYNTTSVNPAYAGSRGTTNFFALYRNQWVGFEGAPQTINVAADFLVGESLGMGISAMSDKIGPSDQKNISVDLAYAINLSERYKLSFGVKGTADFLSVDYSKLNPNDANDYVLENNIDKRFSPNVGVGMYLYSDKTYVGVSVPYMLETKHFEQNATGSGSVLTTNMNVYVLAGHVFDLGENVQFKPSVLTKIQQGVPLQVDASANFLINKKLTLGLAYRWDIAVSAMVGFQITDGLFAGYAYDMETTKLASHNSGSHEVFLRFEIFKPGNGILISPRFF